jgi:hypothetical protein
VESKLESRFLKKKIETRVNQRLNIELVKPKLESGILKKTEKLPSTHSWFTQSSY